MKIIIEIVIADEKFNARDITDWGEHAIACAKTQLVHDEIDEWIADQRTSRNMQFDIVYQDSKFGTISFDRSSLIK